LLPDVGVLYSLWLLWATDGTLLLYIVYGLASVAVTRPLGVKAARQLPAKAQKVLSVAKSSQTHAKHKSVS